MLRYSAKLDARNPAHRKILQTRWRCPNTSCRQAAQWQGQLLAWPRVSPEGAAVCPSCSRHLVALGPRAALHEVVVADLETQEEILRFPLEVDCPVIVGRGAAVKGIDLAMYAEGRSGSASHRHGEQAAPDDAAHERRVGELAAVGDRPELHERDDGAAVDGQRLRPGQARPGRPGDPPGHQGPADPRRHAILLRLSGKRYLAEPTSPHPEAQWPARPPDATAVTRKQR